MSRHREQIRREFDPHGYNANLDAEPLLEWMNLVKFPVHPKFADMLGGMVALKGKVIEETTMTPVVLPPQTSTLDGRERVSLAKLITALAIDAYGFDPSQKRSPIPNEIASIAERLGLRVSNDTIRKYLKIGSENLPEGWRD